MKSLLLTPLLLGSAAVASQAQQAPAVPAPVMAATHADSVAVIHQAFRRARQFGRWGTVVEGLELGVQAFALASSQTTPTGRTLALSGVVSYSGFTLLFLGRWIKFSKRREEQAVQRFELHQPQPLYVQRHLVAYLANMHKPRRKP